MTTIVNDNKACCSLPPVEASYTPKGKYEDFVGIKTYHVGDKASETAIISIMDVFGFSPQTVQGADLLSTANAYVILPDFFDGKPLAHDVFPPDTPEKQKSIQNFFGTYGAPPPNADKVSKIVAELKAAGKSKIFLVGYCWGAKVAMISASRDPINGVLMAHPSLLQVEDAEKSLVPVAMFPSQDEDKALMSAFEAKIKEKPIGEKSVFKTYDDVPHGYAATRGDLENEPGKSQYKDVYQRMVNWVCSF